MQRGAGQSLAAFGTGWCGPSFVAVCVCGSARPQWLALSWWTLTATSRSSPGTRDGRRPPTMARKSPAGQRACHCQVAARRTVPTRVRVSTGTHSCGRVEASPGQQRPLPPSLHRRGGRSRPRRRRAAVLPLRSHPSNSRRRPAAARPGTSPLRPVGPSPGRSCRRVPPPPPRRSRRNVTPSFVLHGGSVARRRDSMGTPPSSAGARASRPAARHPVTLASRMRARASLTGRRGSPEGGTERRPG